MTILKALTANSVGLINCLLQPGLLRMAFESLCEKNHNNLLNLVVPGLFLLPRQSQ